MNRRRLLNYFFVAAAGLSAFFEGPVISRAPLRVAAEELSAAPAAIGAAIRTASANVRGSYLGFDTNVYPGDKAMDAWRSSGEYKWVGYYLEAPCHSDKSWTGKRARLVDSGWGLAVIYVGQQTWGKSYKPVTTTKKVRVSVKKKSGKHGYVTRAMKRTSTVPVATSNDGCSATYVNAAQGVIDARDAIARTTSEGFAPGSVIFLDVEYMTSVPQRMRDYYRAWTRTVLADGMYRPGIYGHTRNAGTIYDDVSEEYDRAGSESEPPFWIAGSKGFSDDAAPTDVGHSFASAWQGLLDVVREHNGVKLPVDVSVSSAPSPSFVQ